MTSTHNNIDILKTQKYHPSVYPPYFMLSGLEGSNSALFPIST